MKKTRFLHDERVTVGIKQAHCTVRQCADAAAMECMYYYLAGATRELYGITGALALLRACGGEERSCVGGV